MKFGIERIRVEDFIDTHIGKEGCRAYVYCPNRSDLANSAIFSALDALLNTIPEPRNFVLNINNPPDYCYTMELSPVEPEKLCDAKSLALHFKEALENLIAWYHQHSERFDALEPKRFKQT